jgi:hypothetical protein
VSAPTRWPWAVSSAARLRHRITTLIRLHQGQQRRPQPGIHIGGSLAGPARPPRPAQRLSAGVQLSNTHRAAHQTPNDAFGTAAIIRLAGYHQ